jgi:low temperature requirement protein LtrA
LWWSYFDRVGPALEHRGEGVEGDRARGRYARDVYTIGHAVIVGGVILAAAALEEITLHPSDEVPDRFRTMLFGGLALMLVGVVACIWRAFGVLARERAVAIAVVGLVVIVAGSINGIVLLFALDLVLVAMLAVEHARIEH